MHCKLIFKTSGELKMRKFPLVLTMLMSTGRINNMACTLLQNRGIKNFGKKSVREGQKT